MTGDLEAGRHQEGHHHREAGIRAAGVTTRADHRAVGVDLDAPDLETRNEIGRAVIRTIRVATAGERGQKTEIETERINKAENSKRKDAKRRRECTK